MYCFICTALVSLQMLYIFRPEKEVEHYSLKKLLPVGRSKAIKVRLVARPWRWQEKAPAATSKGHRLSKWTRPWWLNGAELLYFQEVQFYVSRSGRPAWMGSTSRSGFGQVIRTDCASQWGEPLDERQIHPWNGETSQHQPNIQGALHRGKSLNPRKTESFRSYRTSIPGYTGDESLDSFKRVNQASEFLCGMAYQQVMLAARSRSPSSIGGLHKGPGQLEVPEN